MTEEEKNEMELNIEAKYVGRTEKEFLNNITFAECLYILDTKNNYCDDIRNLSLLKIVDIINKQQSDIDIKDKVIDLIIDDFQTEGYFKKMTYEQVKKYYDNRNELKQEINTLPLNLDLTAK